MTTAIIDKRYTWTREQKQQLKRLFRAGESYKDIAEKMGKSHHGVAKMLKSMGMGRYCKLPVGGPVDCDPAKQYHFQPGDVVTITKGDMAENRVAWKNTRQKFTFVRTYEGKGRFHLFRHRSGYRETFTDAQLGEGME